MTRRLSALALVVALAAAPACGGDPVEDATGEPDGAPAATTGRQLPPAEPAAIMATYEDELAAMGWQMTRANLIDRGERRYEISPDGTHLALYVEPTDGADADEYAEELVPLTAMFATDVFERWPALESFDVCQEPPNEIDDSDEPRPATQVDMTREQAEAVDWDTVDLTELLTVRNALGIRVVIGPDVAATLMVRDAEEAATTPSGG